MAQLPVPPGTEPAAIRPRRWRAAIVAAVVLALVSAAGATWWLRRGDPPPPTVAEAAAALRACTPGTTAKVPLVVLASPDTAGALTTLAADFATGTSDPRGGCIAVTVVARPSGIALSQLVADWDPTNGPEPDVWLPSNSSWLDLLQERMAAEGRASLLPVGRSTPSVASSPTVIAMPRPAAKALGWPARQPSLRDLLAVGDAATGWGSRGHPDWGPLRLGQTDPTVSDQGLDSTIATVYAASGHRDVLTRESVTSSVDLDLLVGLNRATYRYEPDITSLAALWHSAGARAPATLSALLTDERWVAAYNSGAMSERARPAVPMVAVYPPSGSLFADHPYAVLDAPWVEARTQAAAQAFQEFLTSPQAASVWQGEYFRTPDHTLAAPDAEALGLAADQPVVTLPRPTPDAVQAVVGAWRRLAVAAHVLLLVDTSGSMGRPVAGSGSSLTKLAAAQATLTAAAQMFSDRDEVGLWSFAGGSGNGRDFEQVVPLGELGGQSHGRPRRSALASGIAKLQAGGDTCLYATVLAAVDALAAAADGEHPNVILLITDGHNDAVGGPGLDDVLAAIRAVPETDRVRVFAVAYGPDADRPTLEKLAEASGGTVLVAPRAEDLPAAFAQALVLVA